MQVSLLEFDGRLVVLVQFQNDVGEALEIGIDRAIDGDFRVAQGKAALEGIMITQLQPGRRIRHAGPAGINQRAVADVHVSGAGTRRDRGYHRRSDGRHASRHFCDQLLLESSTWGGFRWRGGRRLAGQFIQFPDECVDLLLLLPAGFFKVILHLLQLVLQLLHLCLRRPRRGGEAKRENTGDDVGNFHGDSGTLILLGWARDILLEACNGDARRPRYTVSGPPSAFRHDRQTEKLSQPEARAPAATGSAANPARLPAK